MIESAKDFAARLTVSKACVSGYIRDGKLKGDAVIREGRSVRINVELALKQLKKLDVDQRLANGKAKLRQPAEPAPIADAEMLWGVMREIPGTAAWGAAGAGCTLQQAFDIQAGLALNVVGLLRSYYGAEAPGDLEEVAWQDLADDYDLGIADVTALASDYERRNAPN